MHFRHIRPTRHYLEEHLKDMHWERVVEIIFTTKNPRRKGYVFEIEDERGYVLFTIKEDTIWVINAKP